jgi:hypothetical protein
MDEVAWTQLESPSAQTPDRSSVIAAVTVIVCGEEETSTTVGETDIETRVGGVVSS